MAEPANRRLFFALWPDDSQRRQLQSCFPLLRDCRGRQVVPTNLHLTLAFPGYVDAATQACLERAADAISLPPFSVQLERFGYWPRPRVVWFGPKLVPETLEALAAALNQAMQDCGLEPESRPYRPHITLLRKAHRAPRAEAPTVIWHAQSFALVLSESTPDGVMYRVLRQWALSG